MRQEPTKELRAVRPPVVLLMLSGRGLRDETTASQLDLLIKRQSARINQNTVDFDHPRKRILLVSLGGNIPVPAA